MEPSPRKIYIVLTMCLALTCAGVWFADPEYPGLFEIGGVGRLLHMSQEDVIEELGDPDTRTRSPWIAAARSWTAS